MSYEGSKVYVTLDGESSLKGSLIDEIKSLPKIKKMKSPVEKEPETILFSDLKKKKKKKKKKNKDDPNFFFSEEPEEKEDDTPKLIDVDDLLYGDEDDDDEDSIGAPIIDEQKKGYSKRKQDKNAYKKEFAEELTLLYDLLDELSKFDKDLEKKYKAITSTKVRGVSKFTNDLINSIVSAKAGKLNILKEIAAIKKTIADLKIKADAKKGDDDSKNSSELMATQFLQQALNYGRGNIVKNLTGGSNPGSSNEYDDEMDDLVADIDNKKSNYNTGEIDRYNDIIRNRLMETDNAFRSETGNKYIQYENRGVKIYIKRCIDTGEWRFAALDRDNQEVEDYPVPRKRDVGKVKFRDEFATDDRGRSYKLIEYYSPDYEDR